MRIEAKQVTPHLVDKLAVLKQKGANLLGVCGEIFHDLRGAFVIGNDATPIATPTDPRPSGTRRHNNVFSRLP